MAEASRLRWQKSSYSAGGDNNCVEVAHLPQGNTAVRDSKNPGGAALLASAPAWRAFLAGGWSPGEAHDA